ncbi:uncharacterized protein CPUR_08330 [Claviceps purpurea 20.1]|uniref:Uncharacterized protein n=1 Tax=Claviceps purpurea (strain 20.1) TaxID=1111077 RepID=M1WGB1_CLAP2|nr:uncharacterized protein CPUR_08330 [Claviceps purpurea 20.1]
MVPNGDIKHKTQCLDLTHTIWIVGRCFGSPQALTRAKRSNTSFLLSHLDETPHTAMGTSLRELEQTSTIR